MTTFKRDASITQVTNGYTVTITLPNEKAETQFDHNREEYIYHTLEEAMEKVATYFGA